MKRNEIRKGGTYRGRDGTLRRVLLVGIAYGRTEVGYYGRRGETYCLLSTFARWAEKEVTAPEGAKGESA